MPQSDYNVSVNVQRATRVKDGKGGKTETFGDVTGQTGLTATAHHYSAQKLARIEAVRASGPGVLTRTGLVFTFRQASRPTILVNDRLVLASAFQQNGATVFASGTVFGVQTVRHYARTLQVDAELVA